jgi:glutathione S-transferase
MATTLVTIRFSHFCDKARWALDHCGVAYRERAYLPGLHLFDTRRHGGRSTPLLVTESGVLKQSTEIVAYADRAAPAERRLYPDDPGVRAEVDAFIAEVDRSLGPAVRRVVYHHLLPHPAHLVHAVAGGMSLAERLLFRVAIPRLDPVMRRMMNIDEAGAERSLVAIRRVLADVSARLDDGRRYLFGERLGAADIAFAALAAPAVMPPGHPSYASDISDLPEPLRGFAEEARATAAGRFATRLYAEERRRG